MANLNVLNHNMSILIKGKLVDLSKPKIMGILNVTPDSFYERSRIQNLDELLIQAQGMIENGAEILDLGGISTRPGAQKISVDNEIKRIENAIKVIRNKFPEIIISLDTFNAQTAKVGLENGVNIINDISGGQIDKKIIDVVANYKVPYVLTYSYGMADEKSKEKIIGNIVQHMIFFFSKKINELEEKGIHDIIIDPGFGFGKSLEQNFEILSNFESLKILKKPILVGVSRKSMIYKKLQITVENSLFGTIALNSVLLEKGASIFRVHDVQEMNQIRILLDHN
jgi:dihydropteroate synthase